MNESERIAVVVKLDDCVIEMRVVLSLLKEVSGEDIPEYAHEVNDAFYNACEAKLEQIRDMAKLGHKRFELEWAHRNQMTRDNPFDEKVDHAAGGYTLCSNFDEAMTYGKEALAKARTSR